MLDDVLVFRAIRVDKLNLFIRVLLQNGSCHISKLDCLLFLTLDKLVVIAFRILFEPWVFCGRLLLNITVLVLRVAAFTLFSICWVDAVSDINHFVVEA